MRLFLAIEFPVDVLRKVEAVSRTLMANIPDTRRVIRWVKPEQFHLTLKFLGECPEAALPGLKEAMEETSRRHAPFGLGFSKPGSFKTGRTLRILWLGMDDGTEAAKALASDLKGTCRAAGFPGHERPYHPHLTLARSKGPLPAHLLDKILPAIHPESIGPVRVERLSLIQSILSASGARYTTLYRVPLNSGDAIL